MYPINALRNVALGSATTDFVLLLDVDFSLSTDANAVLAESCRGMNESAALVVPAFELCNSDSSGEARLLRGPKAELMSHPGVSGFHVGHFPKGHRATNFSRFFTAVRDYSVNYEDCFEPYIVIRKSAAGRYDERFRGYGLNKVSHLLLLSRRCSFVVCAGAFAVSPEMQKSESWEKMYGGKAMRDPLLAVKVQVLFDRFRAELRRCKNVVKIEKKVEEKKDVERGTDFVLR